MKNAIMPVVLGLMLVLALGAVAADVSTTIIAGKIYNVGYTDVIQGATVEVTCGDTTLPTVESGDDGAYKVQFEDECIDGDTLTVYAFKGDLTGTKTGTVKESCSISDKENNCLINVFDGVNVAVVNVPLVPEFGAVVGILTALAAVGVFFVVRRR